MPREPISAAEVITFLDQEKCEHCEFEGSPSAVKMHAKGAHYRREMGDDMRKKPPPWIWNREVTEEYRVRVARLYQRGAISREDAIARLRGIYDA